jgi:hypothetical protein
MYYIGNACVILCSTHETPLLASLVVQCHGALTVHSRQKASGFIDLHLPYTLSNTQKHLPSLRLCEHDLAKRSLLTRLSASSSAVRSRNARCLRRYERSSSHHLPSSHTARRLAESGIWLAPCCYPTSVEGWSCTVCCPSAMGWTDAMIEKSVRTMGIQPTNSKGAEPIVPNTTARGSEVYWLWFSQRGVLWCRKESR